MADASASLRMSRRAPVSYTHLESNGKDNGLPIGNVTSQYLANLYLAYFDHWVKEELAKIVMKRFGVKIYYSRYMDDMVILCADKEAFLLYTSSNRGQPLYLGWHELERCWSY